MGLTRNPLSRAHRQLCGALVALVACSMVFAQTSTPAGASSSASSSAVIDYDAKIRQELQAAKNDAEFEFLGTLGRICLLPQSSDVDTSDNVPAYVADPSKAPARQTWFAPSAKVFDNLYFIGGKIHSAWALKTSAGIIVLDTIFTYNSPELIEGGLKKLGLNPKDIKYVVISHAHQDHIGGAEYLQKKYGAKVVMGDLDWKLVETYPHRYQTMAPKRDITATDGMNLQLGSDTIHIWLTPGHTPSTLSYTFTVKDHGKPVNVVYSGGTAFNFVNKTPDPGIQNFQVYIDSQKHIAQKAAESAATVVISNHSEFDNAVNKNRMLAGRGQGPHPYEMGQDWVQRYFSVMQHCARAAQLNLERIRDANAKGV
jgi:metallo-beta-lactamase class B